MTTIHRHLVLNFIPSDRYLTRVDITGDDDQTINQLCEDLAEEYNVNSLNAEFIVFEGELGSMKRIMVLPVPEL